MKVFFIILSLILTCAVQAQVKMRDVIKQMPDSLLPYLNQNARLDFIDFIDSGMKAEVSNDLGGKSQLTELTDDYASLTMNSASQIQLRLLDVNETIDDALPSYTHHIMLSSQAPELTIQRETSLDIPANEEQKEMEKVLNTFKWNNKEFKMY